MAEQDWIEQDEFEKRRAIFGGKATSVPAAIGATVGQGRPSSAIRATPAHKSAEVAAAAAGAGETIQVTVQGLSGETAFGPRDVSRSIAVEELLKLVTLGSEGKRFRRKRLLNGTESMLNLDILERYCDAASTTALTLTIVYDEPLPENSTVVADLVLWVPEEEKSADEEEEDECLGRPRKHRDRKPREQKLIGVNCTTGEAFAYWSSVGRCTSMSLRLGKGGLYYNSSSHGTATLVYRMYNSADDPEGETEKELAIIPGPHHHGPKDAIGIAGAHRLVQRLAEAAGTKLPDVSSASPAVKAWLKVCEDIGIHGSYFATLYMPWLEQLGSMNEYELYQWSESSYPDTIAEIKDTRARELLERGVTPEGAY